ncbi:adenylate kinase family protein [Malacoplasma muris]|uniref:adenylate kinase family protein n=1 Tax=Malacoplasma muris TaxID=2119 RepID=UPI00398E7211
MKLLLLGAPGSGKGTLSEYLISKHNFAHVSTGNIFRKVIDENLEYADELKSYILKGLLVPNDLTNKIVKQELGELTKKYTNIVMDGYPRTIEQAEFLKNIFTIDKVIYLNVDSDLLVKRLTGRRMCNKCKKIYNIYFSPPKKDGVCDNDGELLFQRKDDDLSIIQERIQTYNQTTFLLIDYYKDKGNLIEVDGALSTEELHEKINSILR